MTRNPKTPAPGANDYKALARGLRTAAAPFPVTPGGAQRRPGASFSGA